MSFIALEFNEELYNVIEHPHKDRELCYFIIEYFDRALSAGEFDFCNEVLKTIDVSRLDTQAMLSLTCCARWAREKIPEYERFYSVAYDEAIKKKGLDYAESLYKGLK